IRVVGGTLTMTANDQLGFSTTDTWTKDGAGVLIAQGHTSRMGTTNIIGGTLRLEGDVGYGPLVVGDLGTLELASVAGFFANPITLGAHSTLHATASLMSASSVQAVSGDIFPSLISGPNSTDVFNVTLSSTFGGTVSSFINIDGGGTVNLTHSTNFPGGW